jgi:hypothetical protein
MPKSAIIVSQSGPITDGLPEAVSEIGHDVSETFVAERAEDKRYHLSRSLLEPIEEAVVGLSGSGSGPERPYLVIDGIAHPGQIVDLADRLPPTAVRDRRGAVLESLAEQNPVASVRSELRRAKVSIRREKTKQRGGEHDKPAGERGTVSDYEGRCQRLREQVDMRGKKVRKRVSEEYGGSDGYALVLGGFGARTTEVWSALTGTEKVTRSPTRPASSKTEEVSVGPHTVAVTDVPCIPPEGIGGWFGEAVPSVLGALSRADIVLSVGDETEAGMLEGIAETFGCEHSHIGEPDGTGSVANRALDAVSNSLGSVGCRLRLPYGDGTESLISKLYDDSVVRDVSYGEDVLVHTTVPEDYMDEMKHSVEEIGGEVTVTEASGGGRTSSG